MAKVRAVAQRKRKPRAKPKPRDDAPAPGAPLFTGKTTEIEERVQHIYDLMAEGKYRTAQTPRALAEAWGVHVKVVERYAAEAHRHLRRVIGADGDAKEILLAAIEDIKARCLSNVKVEYRRNDEGEKVPVEVPAPDYASALRALELHARLCGALTTKVELTKPDPFAGMTTEQKRRFAETGELKVIRGGKR